MVRRKLPHSDVNDREAGACKWQEADPKKRGSIVIERLLDEKPRRKSYTIGIFLNDDEEKPIFEVSRAEALRLIKGLGILAELPKKEMF